MAQRGIAIPPRGIGPASVIPADQRDAALRAADIDGRAVLQRDVGTQHMHRTAAAIGIFRGDGAGNHDIRPGVDPDIAALRSAALRSDNPAVVPGQRVDVAAR